MTIYGLKPQNASVSLDYFLFYLTLYFYVFHFFVFLEKRDIKVKQNYIFSLFFLTYLVMFLIKVSYRNLIELT